MRPSPASVRSRATVCRRSSDRSSAARSLHLRPEENEIIIGWNCIGAITYTALRDYRVRNHIIDAWSVPSMNQWQPMNTEPQAPNSPLQC